MNVVFFLTPKANCLCLYEDYTIRQALEKMEKGRYASVPVLKRDGEYIGTISEGDLLWAIKNQYTMNIRDAETHSVLDVTRRRDYIPVRVTTSVDQLLKIALEQNFVPVVDDRDVFIGLVTRQKIMEYYLSQAAN